MADILLFSQLNETNKSAVSSILFSHMKPGETFAYMPSNGIEGAGQYITAWRTIAREHGIGFSVVDNTSTDAYQSEKLLSAATVLISGGNTFQLLHNLRVSGLDKKIVDFSRKQDRILAGFSAGALILTPKITICDLPHFDENIIHLQDLTALGIVDFEIFPHYEKRLHEAAIEGYRKTAGNEVREITDSGYIFVQNH